MASSLGVETLSYPGIMHCAPASVRKPFIRVRDANWSGVRRLVANLVRDVGVGALVMLVNTAVFAQSPRVGYVDSIAGVDPTTTCARNYAVTAPTPSISLVRKDATIALQRRDSAVLMDKLRVNRFVDVRFRVDAERFGNGIFYFAPEFGRCPDAATGLRAAGLAQAGSAIGSYRFSSVTERVANRNVDRLQVYVENGTMVAEWNSGLLSVFALGREIRDKGTVFAVVADSVANQALLVVREGAVTMPGVANFQANAGTAYTFQRGTGRPQQLSLSEAAMTDLVYHSKVIWTQTNRPASGGSLGKTLKILGGAAVLGGGGYLIYQAVNKADAKKKSHTGNVIIHLPI
ncbi:MAG: hypothetical protein ABI852_04415 [Gemmatimonadaceae bacterium]